MKAIVLAAGRGTRISHIPGPKQKVMRQAGRKPLLEYVLENIGFIPQKDTAVVVGHAKEEVKAHIGSGYTFVEQEQARGTGDAVRSAVGFLKENSSTNNSEKDENVIVLYGDMPLISRTTLSGMLETHNANNADCTFLTADAPNAGLRYGKVTYDENGKFLAIIEQRNFTDEQLKTAELNVGAYIFKNSYLQKALTKLSLNMELREFLLTDVPEIIMGLGGKVETYLIGNSNEIFGVNTPEQLTLIDRIITRQSQIMSIRRKRWFGTGGWRAIIGEEFTASNIRKLAQAVADDMKFRGKNEIVIGYDRRFLSDKGAEWAAEVFAANDITVYFINKFVPTPLVMFAVKQLGTYYGMAITASHNPFDYNGIKIFIEGGRDADIEVTDVFESLIERGVHPVQKDFAVSIIEGKIKIINPSNEYIDNILKNLDAEKIRNRELRVLLDPMYGVGKPTLSMILQTARVEVDSIHENQDAYFGGKYPAPAEERLSELKEKVVEGGYSLGIALDGDADRIGIIDDAGRYISANEILAILYFYLLNYRGFKGDVVRNLATSHILDKIAADFGQKCHEVPVGFKWISGKMDEVDALIGGESSGGLTIRGHIKGKDSVFAAAMLVETLAGSGQNFAGLLNEIEFRYGKTESSEFDTKFSLQKKAELLKILFEDKKLPEYEEEIEKVSYLDGAKIYFKNGDWLLARFSGTEPLIRVFAEAGNKQNAKKYVDTMREFLGI